MKRINISIFATLTMVIFSACSLIEEPIDFYNADDFYKDDNQVVMGINGCYSSLRAEDYYLNLFTNVLFNASDMGFGSTGLNSMQQFSKGAVDLTGDHTLLKNVWMSIYSAIGRTNILINALNKSTAPINAGLKQRVIGEAKFLRALHYFNLVRCWGEVPLRKGIVNDYITEIHIPTSSRQEIFDFIIAELKDAESMCWDRAEQRAERYTNEIGRATKLSAMTLRAQVYLYIASSARVAATGQSDNGVRGICDGFKPYADRYKLYYDSCRMVSSKAIELYKDNDFVIENDWANMWDQNLDASKEIIFAVQSSSDTGYGSSLPYFYLPRGCTLGGSFSQNGGIVRIIEDFTKVSLPLSGGKTYTLIDNTDLRCDKGFLTKFKRRKENGELFWRWDVAAYRYTDKPDVNVNPSIWGGKGLFVSKFQDTQTVDMNSSRTDLPILRATELYYMLGESLAEISEAPSAGFSAIDEVRKRCRIEADPTLTDSYINDNFPGSTLMDKFREFIMRERVMEYAAENDRWFTTLRMGKVIEMGKRQYDVNQSTPKTRLWNDYYWPLSQEEINTNKYINKNAPGY